MIGYHKSSWRYKLVHSACLAYVVLLIPSLQGQTTLEERDAPMQAGSVDKAMVALFIGTEGACFSVDGRKHGMPSQGVGLKKCTKLPKQLMEHLVERLGEAKLFSEKDRAPGVIKGSPPESFSIYMVVSGESKQVMFYARDGLYVPEKYLAIFEEVLEISDSETVRKFVQMNRVGLAR